MSYAATLIMHMNFGPKGSRISRELTDFPGVMVFDDWDKKAKKTTRTILFNDAEFKTLDSAVAAWKEKNGTP